MFWFISPAVILFAFTRVGSVLPNRHGSDVIKLFVREGEDVTLPCSPQHKVNLGAALFDWKKDGKDVCMIDNGVPTQYGDFKGRVSYFAEELKHGNASLRIPDTKTTDSGSFTCVFPHLEPGKTYTTELVVGAAPPPYVKIVNVTGDGVLLECLVPGAYPKPRVEWQTSDGGVVHAEEPQVTPRGNRFDVLLLTTVKKNTTTMYRCVVWQDGFFHVTHNELFVPDNLFEDKPSTSTSWPMDAIITIIALIVAVVIALLVIAFLVKKIMNLKKKLKRRSGGGEAGPDEAEAVELRCLSTGGEAGPDEAGQPLSNGYRTTQTTCNDGSSHEYYAQNGQHAFYLSRSNIT